MCALISAPLLSLTAVAGLNTPALAQTKAPFTLGVALPTTGSAAPFGLDQVQALEWAIADINASGGAGGRKLNAVILDTEALTATWLRVPYPIAETQAAMRSAGLPTRLVERLSYGL